MRLVPEALTATEAVVRHQADHASAVGSYVTAHLRSTEPFRGVLALFAASYSQGVATVEESLRATERACDALAETVRRVRDDLVGADLAAAEVLRGLEAQAAFPGLALASHEPGDLVPAPVTDWLSTVAPEEKAGGPPVLLTQLSALAGNVEALHEGVHELAHSVELAEAIHDHTPDPTLEEWSTR